MEKKSKYKNDSILFLSRYILDIYLRLFFYLPLCPKSFENISFPTHVYATNFREAMKAQINIQYFKMASFYFYWQYSWDDGKVVGILAKIECFPNQSQKDTATRNATEIGKPVHCTMLHIVYTQIKLEQRH